MMTSNVARLLVLAFSISATSLSAQATRLPLKQIAQIVDATLSEVIPPESRLSQMTVAERGVRLDFAKTLAGFGYDLDDSTARSMLKLQRVVSAGTALLVSDCDQEGMKPCKLLGDAAYVYLSPESVSDSEAIVRLHVLWATPFPTHVFLSGFSMRVLLRRAASGSWQFSRMTGGTVY